MARRRQPSSPRKKGALPRAALAGTQRRTAWRKATALRVIRESGDDGAACRATGVKRWTLRHWRRTDARFERAYQEARESAVDLLVDEAFRRALGGSDKLLVHLLASLDPARFSSAGQAIRVGGPPPGFGPEDVARAMREAVADVEAATCVEPPPG